MVPKWMQFISGMIVTQTIISLPVRSLGTLAAEPTDWRAAAGSENPENTTYYSGVKSRATTPIHNSIISECRRVSGPVR